MNVSELIEIDESSPVEKLALEKTGEYCQKFAKGFEHEPLEMPLIAVHFFEGYVTCLKGE